MFNLCGLPRRLKIGRRILDRLLGLVLPGGRRRRAIRGYGCTHKLSYAKTNMGGGGGWGNSGITGSESARNRYFGTVTRMRTGGVIGTKRLKFI